MDQSGVFLSVIEAHKGIIYKVADAYCKNQEDKKDVIQEIILQVWRSFDRYNDQFKYSTWIYRIALNVAIAHYRKEHTRKTISTPFTEDLFNVFALPDTNPVAENISLLRAFIAELKELDRALMLLYLDSRSHKEIAEIIGISETNVATRISRIKTILKQKFAHLTT